MSERYVGVREAFVDKDIERKHISQKAFACNQLEMSCWMAAQSVIVQQDNALRTSPTTMSFLLLVLVQLLSKNSKTLQRTKAINQMRRVLSGKRAVCDFFGLNGLDICHLKTTTKGIPWMTILCNRSWLLLYSGIRNYHCNVQSMRMVCFVSID